MAIRTRESGRDFHTEPGRAGYFHLEIPIPEAMDRFAMRVMQVLKPINGPVIEFTENSLVAVMGAEMAHRIDVNLQETLTFIGIKACQTLILVFLI
ncbi:MAG: allophanate hydrolase, partial [Gammaproteobacteria bacterium]|nr:allophanate hydrolase [Gammaproteobacteria bacterium]